MVRRFKEARLLKGIKLTEAAELLGVAQPTLSAWEREAKAPSLENLEAMADLYHVTVDYLLGRPCFDITKNTTIPYEALVAHHGNPVWNPQLGWGLLDTVNMQLLTLSGAVPLAGSNYPLYLSPDSLTLPITDMKPIPRSELFSYGELLIEPISTDTKVKQLRGYYRIKDGYAENSMGNRFFFDTYGIQWLAFNTKEEI